MKEIGGYLGLEEFCGREYYNELIAVNNARNALVYLIRAKEIKKLFISCFRDFRFSSSSRIIYFACET